MKRAVPIAFVAGMLAASLNGLCQEKFNDVRQSMADFLTAVKASSSSSDFATAGRNLAAAVRTWTEDVKPLIVEGVRTNDQFQEYYDRVPEVESGLEAISREIDLADRQAVETEVNSVIWAISHHPRGFDIPQPRYSAWDWVFGLSIGIGFLVLAIASGLYLRRSYYRRYSRHPAGPPKG
jgi:hypothetical protein